MGSTGEIVAMRFVSILSQLFLLRKREEVAYYYGDLFQPCFVKAVQMADGFLFHQFLSRTCHFYKILTSREDVA